MSSLNRSIVEELGHPHPHLVLLQYPDNLGFLYLLLRMVLLAFRLNTNL